jgi:hypothetical protein
VPIAKVLDEPRVKGAIELLRSRPYLDPTSIQLGMDDGFNLTYKRDGGKPWRIEFEGGRANDAKAILPFLDALGKHLDLITHADTLRSALPEREAQVIDYRERTIAAFAVEAAKLSELAAQNTVKLSENIMQRNAELDAAYRDRETKLEATHSARLQELEAREQVLAEKQKLMDTRENTAVRRELFEKIQKIIEDQKKIEISPDTFRKRRPVHSICLLCLVVALGLMGAFGYKVLTVTSPDWHLFVPLSAGVVLFVTTSVFYVKWSDDWFAEHADAEFRNRKFKADIARASWIAELLFEDKKREPVLPPELVASYAANLFKDESRMPIRHPYEDLAALLKNVSSMKVSKAGVEVVKEASKDRPA